MTTFVLCHGAWSGGWAWTGIADILRERGHRVFVPTYTGLGERAHLASPEVDLSTHITDVRALIEWERLGEFALVGYSYGGMVITGVADKEWRKITKIVYLDAFLPGNEQCLKDLTGPEWAAARAAADAKGDGWLLPRPDGSISGTMPAEGRQWIESLGRPHPLKTMTEKLIIDGNHLKIAEKVYILATENPGSPFHQFADWTRAQGDWTTLELPTHHHMFQSMPEETAEMLIGEN
jgi:pimeloyl-ACP methyl ester carboxylesterase